MELAAVILAPALAGQKLSAAVWLSSVRMGRGLPAPIGGRSPRWTPSCAATLPTGSIVAARRSFGDEAVREALAEGVPPPTTASGGVRIEHELRSLIASA